MKKSLISVYVGASFLTLAASGVYAFFAGYSSTNVFVHVLFGWLFLFGVVFHLRNNISSLFRYFKRVDTRIVLVCISALVFAIFAGFSPIERIQDWYKEYKIALPREQSEEFVLYDFSTESGHKIELEILAGEHFWFPQMSIWIEDTLGNYVESLMVTYSTSKGVFYSGRTKYNFKQLDKSLDTGLRKIRVDALPYWSHKRGVKYQDGYFSPPPDQPLPDGITGATPQGSLKLKLTTDSLSHFRILLEVNVAFDDNEYFSEFDYPDDTLYHGGAGLLGQPSLVYSSMVAIDDGKKYYLMDPIGHGHHSGQTGELFRTLERLTTATQIFERVIVKLESK